MKKYFKFNLTYVNIIICAICIFFGICSGNYFDICGWVSALFAWVLVALKEKWND